MARAIDSATKTALQQPTLYLVWFIALEINSDPVYINTSYINISFGGGLGYDPAIVGNTFIGAANVLTISPIIDTRDGSQSLKLSLPGVRLDDDYLHQIINNGDIWQRAKCYIWIATYDATGVLIGKPIRVKSGRLDQLVMTIDPGQSTGTLDATIESQASYQGEASDYKYSDQLRVDPTDKSQQFVAWLANQVAQIGTPNAVASGAFGGSIGGSIGRNYGIF